MLRGTSWDMKCTWMDRFDVWNGVYTVVLELKLNLDVCSLHHLDRLKLEMYWP